MNTLNDLKSFLSDRPPGAINHPSSHLDSLLADCWSQFSGDDGCMSGDKLIGRMESVKWNSPHLTFTIERHGGTFMGLHEPNFKTGQSTLTTPRLRLSTSDSGNFSPLPNGCMSQGLPPTSFSRFCLRTILTT